MSCGSRMVIAEHFLPFCATKHKESEDERTRQKYRILNGFNGFRGVRPLVHMAFIIPLAGVLGGSAP